MNIRAFRQDRNRSRQIGQVGCIIFAIIGVILIVAGIYIGIRNSGASNKYSGEVSAVCESYEVVEEFDNDSISTNYIYYPVFKYVIDSVTYIEKHDVGSSIKSYDIGEEITILYNPERPQDFRIKGDKTELLVVIILLSFGALFVLGGISSYIRFKKFENEPVSEHISESVTKIDESVEPFSNEEHKIELPEK